MKKLALGLLAATFIFASCKKEDKAPALELEGKWQLTKADFLSADAHWVDSIDYNEGKYFGHAPSMFEIYQGFDFKTEKVTDVAGNRLIIHNTRVAITEESDYWYWNYLDDGKGFEIKQVKPNVPPYNFSILDIKNIEITNEGKEVTFEAEVYSRIPGQSLMSTQMLPVRITMVKGEPTEHPEVFILGAKFTHP